jgi:hypothetical protein
VFVNKGEQINEYIYSLRDVIKYFSFGDAAVAGLREEVHIKILYTAERKFQFVREPALFRMLENITDNDVEKYLSDYKKINNFINAVHSVAAGDSGESAAAYNDTASIYNNSRFHDDAASIVSLRESNLTGSFADRYCDELRRKLVEANEMRDEAVLSRNDAENHAEQLQAELDRFNETVEWPKGNKKNIIKAYNEVVDQNKRLQQRLNDFENEPGVKPRDCDSASSHSSASSNDSGGKSKKRAMDALTPRARESLGQAQDSITPPAPATCYDIVLQKSYMPVKNVHGNLYWNWRVKVYREEDSDNEYEHLQMQSMSAKRCELLEKWLRRYQGVGLSMVDVEAFMHRNRRIYTERDLQNYRGDEEIERYASQ